MRFLPCSEENGGDKSVAVAVRGNTEGKEVANLFPYDLVVIREREYFLAVSNKIFSQGVPGVLRCRWRGVFTGVCSKLLSGLMSCRKVGLRESSSSWRNRSNGRHVLFCSYWRGVLSKKMFQIFSLKDMEGRAMFLLLVKHS